MKNGQGGPPPATRNVVFALALALLSSGAGAHQDLHEKLARLDAEIADAPHDASLYMKRAELRRLHDELDGAEADLDRASELDPDLAGILLGRAALARAREAFDEALEWVDRFLGREPESVVGHRLRADVLASLDRVPEAAVAMERVLALSAAPRVDDVHRSATLLEEAGQPSAAVRVIDEASAVIGPVASLEILAAHLLGRTGATDAALARLDAPVVAGLRPDRRLDERAHVLAAGGRMLEAMAAWSDALDHLSSLPDRVRAREATRQAVREIEERLEALAAELADGAADAEPTPEP